MSNKVKISVGYRLMIAALVVAAVLSANVGGAKAAPIVVGSIGTIVGASGDKINARSGPSTAYDVNVQLGGGQAVEVYDGPRTDKSGNVWYKVRNENGGGWVVSEYLDGKASSTSKAQLSSNNSSKPASSPQQASSTGSAAKIKTGGALKVTDDNVRMRSQAGSKGSILATVGSGTVLKVLSGPSTDSAGNKWYQVSGKYTTGWISADYVAASSATPPSLLKQVADVRSISSLTSRGGSRSDTENTTTQPAPVQAQPAPAAEQPAPVQAQPAPAAEQPAPAAEQPILDTSAIAKSIVATALPFNGYRYVYGAASPKRGFDCSGLIYYTMARNGISVPRTTTTLWAAGTSVKRSDLMPGDVVFFANTYKPGISHAGIYIGNGQMIHAENESTGVMISSINSPYYASRYAGARRYR